MSLGTAIQGCCCIFWFGWRLPSLCICAYRALSRGTCLLQYLGICSVVDCAESRPAAAHVSVCKLFCSHTTGHYTHSCRHMRGLCWSTSSRPASRGCVSKGVRFQTGALVHLGSYRLNNHLFFVWLLHEAEAQLTRKVSFRHNTCTSTDWKAEKPPSNRMRQTTFTQPTQITCESFLAAHRLTVSVSFFFFHHSNTADH